MKGYRNDPTISVVDNIKKVLEKEDEILHTYEVVPLDYRINDYSSPKFYITKKYLIFGFDEGFEVYGLDALEVTSVGNPPSFDTNEVLFSAVKLYLPSEALQLEKLKQSDTLYRISINEPKEVPKYFLSRQGTIISPSYKSWALMQLIRNVKIGNYNNESLIEMMNGYFSSFNQKTLLYFIIAFIVYVLLRIISTLVLPSLVGTILDVIFGIIVVFIMYWLWVSVDRNIKRYERNYHTYSGVN